MTRDDKRLPVSRCRRDRLCLRCLSPERGKKQDMYQLWILPGWKIKVNSHQDYIRSAPAKLL